MHNQSPAFTTSIEEPELQRVLDCARVALCAEQLGSAQACLDVTTAYATDRVQFGRPIGSFQAVKHRLADMMMHVEAARSAAYYAACTVDEDSQRLSEAAATAQIVCEKALKVCARDMIQFHGGIGFTWEHVAHLYFKRARTSSWILGNPDAAAGRLADAIFAPKGASLQ